jgi:hypothetical protein
MASSKVKWLGEMQEKTRSAPKLVSCTKVVQRFGWLNELYQAGKLPGGALWEEAGTPSSAKRKRAGAALAATLALFLFKGLARPSSPHLFIPRIT